MSISDDETRIGPQDEPLMGSLGQGDRLGDYRILDILGRGAMGEVYLAEHVHLKQRYALKVLPAELSKSGSFKARFREEARTLAGLKHQNIIMVHNAGEDQGRFYLAMEHVEGGSLEDYLKNEGGRLKAGEVQDILQQMLEGLSYAHGKGVIHRDLKPANILRTGEGKIKISDFGLARVVGEEYVQSMIQKSITLSQMGDRSTRIGGKGSSGSSDYVGTRGHDRLYEPGGAGGPDGRYPERSLCGGHHRLLSVDGQKAPGHGQTGVQGGQRAQSEMGQPD